MTMAPAQTRTSHQRVQAGAGVPMMVSVTIRENFAMVRPWVRPVDAPLCSAGTPTDFARSQGSEKLLMKLSHGKVASCPFSDQSIAALKRQVVSDLEQVGLHLSRNTQDRRHVSIDNRVLDTDDFSASGTVETQEEMEARGAGRTLGLS